MRVVLWLAMALVGLAGAAWGQTPPAMVQPRQSSEPSEPRMEPVGHDSGIVDHGSTKVIGWTDQFALASPRQPVAGSESYAPSAGAADDVVPAFNRLPEPASMCLMILGGLLAFRARRWGPPAR